MVSCVWTLAVTGLLTYFTVLSGDEDRHGLGAELLPLTHDLRRLLKLDESDRWVLGWGGCARACVCRGADSGAQDLSGFPSLAQ
jgi:hypothetical protein